MIVSELEGSKSYYGYKDRCIFCDIIREELRKEIRIVCQSEHFIAIAPYAPRSPFETWILPREHSSSYIDMGEGHLESLTTISNSLIPNHQSLIRPTAFRRLRLIHFAQNAMIGGFRCFPPSKPSYCLHALDPTTSQIRPPW